MLSFWRKSGQAIVEFAFVLPILMLLLLGAVEVGFAFMHQRDYKGAAEVIADWAALHTNELTSENWHSVLNQELRASGCDLDGQPEVEINKQIVSVVLHCKYKSTVAEGILGSARISVRADAAVFTVPEAPSLLPSLLPSPSL